MCYLVTRVMMKEIGLLPIAKYYIYIQKLVNKNNTVLPT